MTDVQYNKRYRHGARLKKIVLAWKALPLGKLTKKQRVQVLLFGTDAVGMDRTFVQEKCSLDADVPQIPSSSDPASDSENE